MRNFKMNKNLNVSMAVGIAAAAVLAASATAGFTSYQIRANNGIFMDLIDNPAGFDAGTKEFIVALGGQKAGWGTNDANATIGQLSDIRMTRYNNVGSEWAPYINIWITDGTNYAVAATAYSPKTVRALGGWDYNFNYSDLAGMQVNIYETPGGGGYGPGTSWVHQELGKSGQTLTWADIASFNIAPPSQSWFASNPAGVGGGAPREFGTNVAYGFNWIFGDTLANFVSGDPGYVVGGLEVVPAPGAIALVGLAGLIGGRRRRN